MPPVVILTGGLGTRLGSLARDNPKALVNIGGEPFIAHQLRLLKRQGVQRVVLCLGHLGEQIKSTVGDGANFDLAVDYSFDGSILRGTGGAVQHALPVIANRTFLLLYGDSYLLCDFSRIYRAFVESRLPALMTVIRGAKATDPCNAEYSAGLVVRYDKVDRTPSMKHVDYGLEVLTSTLFEPLTGERSFDLSEIFQNMAATNRLAGYQVNDPYYEVGSPEGLDRTRRFLMNPANRTVPHWLGKEGT